TFNVTPDGKDLDAIASELTLSGGAGANSLNVHDENNPNAVTYTLTMDTLDRTGAATITVDLVNMPLVLDGGAGGNVFDVTESPVLTSFTLVGGVGMDTLRAPNEVNVFKITGSNAGEADYALGAVHFAGVESLTGNNQADTFEFLGGSLDGTIDG